MDPGFLERGFICIKVCVCVWGVYFADFISFCLNIPWKWNNLVSLRPNYYIFIGYLNKGSRISRKGSHMYKGVEVQFADFISFCLNIPWKWNNLVSLRPNYYIFIGYLKNEGAGRGVRATPSGSSTDKTEVYFAAYGPRCISNGYIV